MSRKIVTLLYLLKCRAFFISLAKYTHVVIDQQVQLYFTQEHQLFLYYFD